MSAAEGTKRTFLIVKKVSNVSGSITHPDAKNTTNLYACVCILYTYICNDIVNNSRPELGGNVRVASRSPVCMLAFQLLVRFKPV